MVFIGFIGLCEQIEGCNVVYGLGIDHIGKVGLVVEKDLVIGMQGFEIFFQYRVDAFVLRDLGDIIDAGHGKQVEKERKKQMDRTGFQWPHLTRIKSG